MKSLQNRAVVVTGASAGVGRAAVREFASRGADVALIARGTDGLEAAAREVEAMGRRALMLPLDVADAAAMDEAAETVERELGPVDVWVNNAMTSVFSPVIETTAEEYRRVTEVTYLGYVHGTLSALRRMKARNCGSIVQVSSALAFRSIPLQSAYCAAKHAIAGFTESLRSELIHDRSRIHVTMVHMPALNTPQFGWVKSRLDYKAQPVPPIFQPEVAAEAIAYAATHRRRDIAVGMSTVKAIIGDKFIPGWLDRYLAAYGYSRQQTNEPRPPSQPENLWHPVPGDHGAHGDFDDRAQPRSIQLWLTERRGALAAATLALTGLATVAALRRA